MEIPGWIVSPFQPMTSSFPAIRECPQITQIDPDSPAHSKNAEARLLVRRDYESAVVLPSITETAFPAQRPPLCGLGGLGGSKIGLGGWIWVIGVVCGQLSVLSVPLWFFERILEPARRDDICVYLRDLRFPKQKIAGVVEDPRG